MFNALRRRLPSPSSRPIRYAIAGDSITAWEDSWHNQLADPALIHAGGWARSGVHTERVLENIERVEADVLVVMLGTNDVKFQVPLDMMTTNVERIVDTVGVPNVLVCLVPPNNYTHGGVNRRRDGLLANRHLSELAAQHGWMVADPFSFARATNNAWGGGMSVDGTHPTTATSKRAAERMRVYIRQAAAAGSMSLV